MNEFTKNIKNLDMIYSNFGYISYKFNDKIYFKIVKLIYQRYENEEFKYSFIPYDNVLDLLEIIDIPGIDLSLKQSVYYRTNITP